MPRIDRYGNTIEDAPSVISSSHPDNMGRHSHNDSQRAYTFRQRTRNTKLQFTLGWELEANHTPEDRFIPRGVERISDGSVNGHGAEFVVLPAVTKSPRYVLGLLKDLTHAPRLNTDDSCGFHVHVSAANVSSIAKMRQWAIATEHLAMQIESLAFDAVPESRKSNTYCKRITPLASGQTFEAHKYNNSRRYHWLNTVEMFRPNGIRTLEVRLLGHTHRWKYLLAWSLFSLTLARRGWELYLNPFQMTGHVDALGNMLKLIAKEIKPLSKKSEPIPQWVYQGLADFGITTDVWDRPLAALTEKEDALKGLRPKWYSDNQPEEENESNDDECECGCGSDGRCDSQLHSDGDCDSNYCNYCHEDGNCSGSPRCESCREARHDDGEDCGRSTCSTCQPERPAVRRVTVDPAIHPSNMTVNMEGATTGRTGTPTGLPPSEPLTFTAMQQAINTLRNQAVDSMHMQINNAMIYGQGIGSLVHYDEAAHIPVITPSIYEERRASEMLSEAERVESSERVLHSMNQQGGR